MILTEVGIPKYAKPLDASEHCLAISTLDEVMCTVSIMLKGSIGANEMGDSQFFTVWWEANISPKFSSSSSLGIMLLGSNSSSILFPC